MSNSIDNNLNRENNSMPSLTFFWTAVFSDDKIISQIENKKEHRFQEVKDKFSELEYFYLTNHKDKIFKVDLNNGIISLNKNNSKPEPELLGFKKENIRLIFFRRNWKTFNTSGNQLSHKINYFLGFQYNDKEGKNRKILFQIDSEGNFIIGE